MATTALPRAIEDVAAALGITRDHLLLFGEGKAKIRNAARNNGREPGKLILVSAITPTSAGEGKTTTSIGLAQGLAKRKQNVCLALREPSLGPTFGMKGGATGGGKSTVRLDCFSTGSGFGFSSVVALLSPTSSIRASQYRAASGSPPRSDLCRAEIMLKCSSADLS